MRKNFSRSILAFAFASVPSLFLAGTAISQTMKSQKGVGVTYSTKIDFDSTMIEGKMKAPTGFFLQGRNKQSLQSMVKLRSSFKDKLRNSRYGVKAIAK